MNYNLLSTNPQIINLFSNLILLNHEVEDEITECGMEKKIGIFSSILNSSSWKTTMICYFLLIQLNLWLPKSLIQALFWLDSIIIGWMMIFMAIDFWFFLFDNFRGWKFLANLINDEINSIRSKNRELFNFINFWTWMNPLNFAFAGFFYAIDKIEIFRYLG